MPAIRKTHRGKKAAGAANSDFNSDPPLTAVHSQKGTHDKQRKHHPSEADIVKAVSSLYEDRLRPFSRILRKRLVEQFEASRGADGKDCSAAWLQSFCNDCPRFEVHLEAGGEWSVLLKNKPGNFVDFHESQDPYPEELWRAMRGFADRLGREQNASLPGGRYGSAFDLMKRRLPFLSDYTLGEVCHIIELAISQRNILGYSNGAIVPYELSASKVKSAYARDRKSLKADVDGGRSDCVDWETARMKLREILDAAIARGMNQVPLSNVKRLFRSLYDLELSETALGHAKLTDLLQDTRFSDICFVQLKERGYVVLPAWSLGEVVGRSVQDVDHHREVSPKADKVNEMENVTYELHHADVRQICMDAALSKPRRSHSIPKSFTFNGTDEKAHRHGSQARAPAGKSAQLQSSVHAQRLQFCLDEPLCLELAGANESLVHSPAHPFPLPTPSPKSSQKPGIDNTTAWQATCLALGFIPYDVDSLDDEECKSGSDAASTDGSRFCSMQPLCFQELGHADATKTPLMPFSLATPSPVYSRSMNAKITEAVVVPHITVLPVISNPVGDAWQATCEALGVHSQTECALDYTTCIGVFDHVYQEHTKFCVNEPLCFDAVDGDGAKQPSATPFSLLTPSPRYSSSCDVAWPKELCSNNSLQTAENDFDALARSVLEASSEQLSSHRLNAAELSMICPKNPDVPVLRIASFL